jgi:hypothetical protein
MEKLTEKLQNIAKEGFVIYCGAGISIPAPSCAPSWWTLTEEILEAFFNRAPENWGVPKDLIIKDENKQPESIFETFANILEGKFYQIFDSLNVTEPNTNHKLIAKLAKKGILKACITTNFDIFIERALKDENVDFKLLVENSEYENFLNSINDSKKFILCKIHGTIERPDSIVSVASAYKSTKGFSGPKADLIEKFVHNYPLLFLGYAGWDFNHLNYRRFWERVGPKVKAIYWNMRPNEKSSVPFRDIFETFWDRFYFIQGELPIDFLSSATQLIEFSDKEKMITTIPSNSENDFFSNAKSKRLEFFNKWSFDLPLPHVLGLVMSQAFMFSQQFKDYMQTLKEVQDDKDAISYSDSADVSTEMKKLAEKLSKGEITSEQFQQEQNMMSLRIQLKHIRRSYQDAIIEKIMGNAYPGITDNLTVRSSWLGYIMQLTQNFDLENSLKIANEIALDYKRILANYNQEAQADMLIIGYKATIMHPKEQLWKPYYDKMLQLKKQFLNDELDYTQYATDLGKVISEQSKAKIGMTVPLDLMAKNLIESIASIESDKDFVESLEVLLISMDLIGGWLNSELYQDKGFQEHYYELIKKPENPDVFPVENMIGLDEHFRKMYEPIISRINRMNDPKTAKILLDLTILGRWKDLMQSIGGEYGSFSQHWDEGRYPLRSTHPKAYSFHKEKFMEWLEEGLTTLSHRVIQKMVRYIVGLAETGGDIELVKKLTFKSLELTNGLVTEATPQEIPGIYAAFLDLNGNKEEALKYYNMSLDALKTAVPPLYQEPILYRTAILMGEFPDKYTKKDILKTIGRFHSTYYGNQPYASSGSPSKDLAVQLAEKLAKEEGFTNAKQGIAELLEY